MKGVILNVVEEVVSEQFGEDTWDDLLADAGLDGAYTALGNYDDAELAALVRAASRRLRTTDEDVLRLVGRLGFQHLARRYPPLLVDHRSSRTVLADLNGVIHPQVLSLHPGASVPDFGFSEGPTHVRLVYRSSRQLCHLAEGLALGLAHHFDELVEVRQERCRLRGDDECKIIVEYGPDG